MHIFIFVILKAPYQPCKTKCTVLKIECAFTFSINIFSKFKSLLKMGLIFNKKTDKLIFL